MNQARDKFPRATPDEITHYLGNSEDKSGRLSLSIILLIVVFASILCLLTLWGLVIGFWRLVLWLWA